MFLRQISTTSKQTNKKQNKKTKNKEEEEDSDDCSIHYETLGRPGVGLGGWWGGGGVEDPPILVLNREMLSSIVDISTFHCQLLWKEIKITGTHKRKTRARSATDDSDWQVYCVTSSLTWLSLGLASKSTLIPCNTQWDLNQSQQ